MLEVLALSAFLSSDPGACALSAVGEDERQRPEALTVECPGEDPALLAAAQDTLARMDLNLDRASRFGRYEVADTLLMIPGDQGWRAAPGQILIRIEPLFPARAAERGSTHMLCAIALRPDAQGRVDDAPVECVSDVRRVTGAMERSAREAVANWRLAPTNVAYCMDEQIYASATIIVRGGPPHTPNPMPDPAQLPALCEAG